MQKSQIGTAALFLAAVFGMLTVMNLVLARMTDEESRALTALKREACLARAYMPSDQSRCRAIEPETGFIVARLPIPGFFALSTLLTLGFGLAMLARPNDPEAPAALPNDAERDRQRRLALAAQEKLQEERAKSGAEG